MKKRIKKKKGQVKVTSIPAGNGEYAEKMRLLHYHLRNASRLVGEMYELIKPKGAEVAIDDPRQLKMFPDEN